MEVKAGGLLLQYTTSKTANVIINFTVIINISLKIVEISLRLSVYETGLIEMENMKVFI